MHFIISFSFIPFATSFISIQVFEISVFISMEFAINHSNCYYAQKKLHKNLKKKTHLKWYLQLYTFYLFFFKISNAHKLKHLCTFFHSTEKWINLFLDLWIAWNVIILCIEIYLFVCFYKIIRNVYSCHLDEKIKELHIFFVFFFRECCIFTYA